jgi:hypothetical protein
MAKVTLKPVHSGVAISALAFIVIKENMETSLSFSSSHRELKNDLVKYIKNEKAKEFVRNSDYRVTNLIVSKFGDDIPTKALFEYNSRYVGFGSRRYQSEYTQLIPNVNFPKFSRKKI